MVYQVNGKEYRLASGDCLFVNSNALHMGEAIDGHNCSYCALTANPALFGREEGAVRRRYVTPILKSGALSSFLFRPDNGWHREVIEAVIADRRHLPETVSGL